MMIRKRLFKCLLCCILWISFIGVPAANMPTVSKAAQPAFDQMVGQVIDKLSSEPGFSAWKNVSWTKYPLGPGTHQWLVLLTDPVGDEAGYLVLNAVEKGGWQLQEYGVGAYPLFGKSTFQNRLQANATKSFETHRKEWDNAIRYFIHSFETVWAVPIEDGKMEYIDGVTSEAYPAEWVEMTLDDLTEKAFPEYQQGFPLPIEGEHSYTLSSQSIHQRFNPYDRMSWLVAEPVLLDPPTLDPASQYVYVSSIFNQHIHVPWAVTGMQIWNEFTFLKIETEGIARYIPEWTFQQYGELYPVL